MSPHLEPSKKRKEEKDITEPKEDRRHRTSPSLCPNADIGVAARHNTALRLLCLSSSRRHLLSPPVHPVGSLAAKPSVALLDAVVCSTVEGP